MKRLVVCADGTWNEPSSKIGGKPCPTNVVRMAQAVLPVASGVSQVVYYHDGVGTHPGIDRILGGMFGLGLDRVVQDIYRFLVHNFTPGDEIYLFGFSRGAYTARSVAGMIRKCGILRKTIVDEVSDAFDFYRGPVKPADAEAVAWRAARSVETRIKCVGVWDTVGALGIPFSPLRAIASQRFAFHDVKLSTFVDNAFHAIAIDERRKPFMPTLWEVQAPDPAFPQTVKQVWFVGVHSDVGGGYPENALSNVTFRWMAEQASNSGLVLDRRLVDGVTGDSCGPLHDSMDFFYLLLGDGTRTIGAPTPEPITSYPVSMETIDPSVAVRVAGCADRDERYYPEPLRQFFP